MGIDPEWLYKTKYQIGCQLDQEEASDDIIEKEVERLF